MGLLGPPGADLSSMPGLPASLPTVLAQYRTPDPKGPAQAPMTDLDHLEAELQDLRGRLFTLRSHLELKLLGQREVLDQMLIALLADGHVLLEGAPGLGKTTLVRAMAEGLDLSFGRIQCTPDLMPGDVLGARILQMEDDGTRRFEFLPGPVFTQILLADEINRATPRTQSALLEAMAEKQVTVHGETRTLERPFLVVATQNPIEMEGTYPLPEAQLDRFMMKVFLDMPDQETLDEILRNTTNIKAEAGPAELTNKDLLRLQELVRQMPVGDDLRSLISATTLATHPNDPRAPTEIKALVRHGASPRGAQSLLFSAKARALLQGRLAPSREDLEAMVGACLGHRLVLGYEAEAVGTDARDLAREALNAVCG